jgi:hypothetical protein
MRVSWLGGEAVRHDDSGGYSCRSWAVMLGGFVVLGLIGCLLIGRGCAAAAQVPGAPPPGMSDPVKVALITAGGAVGVGILALLVAVLRQGAANSERLDGRLTQLLEVTTNVARAIGLKEGEEIGHARGLAEGEARAAAREAGQAAGLELTGRRPVQKP